MRQIGIISLLASCWDVEPSAVTLETSGPRGRSFQSLLAPELDASGGFSSLLAALPCPLRNLSDKPPSTRF